MNKNLLDELKEVDDSIVELKKQLSTEELDLIKIQEEEIEKDIKEIKKKRKSLFSSRRHSKTPRDSASISTSGDSSPKGTKKSDKKEKEKKSKK
jgi:D-tyrosyl-tRNA(Tyr) deacylase